MANTTLTAAEITKNAAIRLKNKLVLAQNVSREYDPDFKPGGAAKGMTYSVRKAPRYLGRDGEALQVEASDESYVNMTLQIAGCDTSFSTTDLERNVEDFMQNFLEAQLDTIANKIDVAIANLYKDVNRIVNHGASAASYGTSGALNGGSQTLAGVQGQILTAGAILTENGAPTSSRSLILDPMSQVSAATVMTSLFNPSPKISKIFEGGEFAANTLGFDWACGANIQGFTPLASGTATALAAVPTVGASTISVTCTGTAVLPRGSILSMAGNYAINPQHRNSTGRLMQYVVTQDTTLSAAAVNIPVYPPYIPSGKDATSIGTPSTGAGTVVFYTGAVGGVAQSQNMAFQKEAFQLVTANQMLPNDVHFKSQQSYDGITLRILRQYDINSNQLPCRVDCLYSVATIYPELAVRVGG